MTVQYIKDTIKKATESEKKQEDSNHNFVSNFLESWNMFLKDYKLEIEEVL